MEDTLLDRETNQLKMELDHKNNDLVLAAEIGKKLLEQNQDLEDRLEQLAYDHTKRLEQLEQDKYSLQMKLNAKDKLEQSQVAEIESLRESLQNERDSARSAERMGMTHSKEIQKMTEKIEELQIAQERAAMIEEQLRKKVVQQDDLLKDAHNKLSSLEVAPDKNDEQLYSLQHDLATSKSEKDVIVLELEDSKHKCQQLMFTIDVQKQRLQTLGNEVEEKEQQITGYYNMLEKTQEEVVDLRLELDAAKMEETDINKRGNSLFAEVEDRRKEIENKMISLKVQSESFKEQLNMKKQQVHKMRFQIAALLQMGGGRADSSQRERLEQSLEQSRSEVHMLTEKIKRLEKSKTSDGMEHQLQEYKKLLSESEKPDLVEFLQHKLRTAKSDIENLRKELETQQLLQISASDKLMDCERRLYNAETETDRTRAVNMKLMVTIDDLKLKINGKEAGSTKTKISTGYREKISLKKSTNKENVSDSSPPKGQEGVNKSSSPSQEIPSDEMVSPEQKPPITSDVTLASTNQKQDTIGHEGYILKPANQNQDMMLSRPVKKQSKKSVSMCETVSVLAAGTSDATSESLKSGDDASTGGGKRSRHVESVSEENEDPEMRQTVGGSRGSRHGGKKHHKVVHMKSNNAAECNQQ
ncbi:protein Spindly-like [Asterias amurensis]|uniref:protein Spindly-like n=1 Tax=Asterias amurensis TaxID=7602 RepID=UPI003AB2F83E